VSKAIKHTDLSGEDPSPRAAVEGIKLTGQLPLVGAKLTMKAKMIPDSSLSRLVATVTLTSCGCACAFTAYLSAMPHWAVAGALAMPTALYAGLCRFRTRK
jgi:hypothetical protein